MNKVKLNKSLFVRGQMLAKGEIVEVNKREAYELISRGVAEHAEPTIEVDVDIDDNSLVAIEDMTKNDLIEYATELGIDIPSKANKAEIIDLINAFDGEDE